MQFITPHWQAPNNVIALSTARKGGYSLAPYDSFNLGLHVGDEQHLVEKNRQLLIEQGNLPYYPKFLNQIHSTQVIELPNNDEIINADAAYTNQANQVCLVMTADCLPVLFTNFQGNEVAAAHAGWRGLCEGILENTVAKFSCPKNEIIAWLGPAISQRYFQVGQEVLNAFLAQDPHSHQAFSADKRENGKYFADLYQLARFRLKALGINKIFGGEFCTYSENDKFFSYRRDKQTGRMASLIWFTD